MNCLFGANMGTNTAPPFKSIRDSLRDIILGEDGPDQGEPVSQIVKFTVGQHVEKYTGDYQLVGEVRAVFLTRNGKVRYVVEHHQGFLHIYNESQLRTLPSG